MPRYITLYNWTERGVKAVDQTVDRTEQATALAQQLGATNIQAFWTQGRYDLVAIGDWPDEETAQAFALQLARLGNARSETLRAFDAEEMRSILSKLR